MIIMSGGLHVAEIAIKHFSSKYNLILIGNGFVKDESNWVNEKFSKYGFINIKSRQYHHNVLDAVFSVWGMDFGIIDYDCFIMDQTLLDECVELDELTSVSAPFKARKNPEYQFFMPDTFLMFFNVALLKKYKKLYGVGTAIYKWNELSGRVQSRLKLVGLSESVMPDHEKKYFDTLRALLLLCLSYGYRPKFIKNHIGDSVRCVHVGDVAKPNTHRTTYGLRGSYFWRVALKASGDPVLTKVASAKFKDVDLDSFRNKFDDIDEELGEAFLEFCTQVLAVK